MNIKKKFQSIDQGQLSESQKEILGKIKSATKDFTITDEKALQRVDSALDNIIEKLKKTNPQAIKGEKKTDEAKPEKEVAKKEPKNETKTPKEPKKEVGGKRTIFSIAKEIRKADESWEEAKKRAKKVMEGEREETTKKMKTETDKLLAFIKRRKELEGLSGTSVKKDSKVEAMPKGRRVSKKGWKNQYGESEGGKVYYENRDNRSDRLAPKFEDKIYLEDGGYADGGYVVIAKSEKGGGFVMSKPSTEAKAKKLKSLLTKIEGETNEVMTVAEASKLSGLVGKEYLKYADGGTIIGVPETPLDRGLGMDYTTLVGETGAMSSGEMFAEGGSITDTADAIFYPNQKNGKIKTSFGDKTKEGLFAMISNVNYDAKEISDAIFEFNEKSDRIKTGFGSKTKQGLTEMIKNVRNTFAEGVYVETLDEEIDLSSEGNPRVKKTQEGKKMSEEEWMAKHNDSTEARAYAEGGGIPNNYYGKHYGDIWDKEWNDEQKNHFLLDHVNEIGFNEELYGTNGKKSTKKEKSSKGSDAGFKYIDKEKLINSKNYDLPRYVKFSLEKHIREGQYEKGGTTRERRYVNDSEDYEVRYSKDKPHRRGYGYAEGGTIDAFQMRLVRGVDSKPSEVLTTEQEVQFAKGGGIGKKKTQKELRNEYLEELGQNEADVWDKIGAKSGSEIRNNEEILKKYAESVSEMLQKEGVGKGSFDQEDYDFYTDENWHLFNEFLVWNGYYEPEMTKTEKAWREDRLKDPKYKNYVVNPNVITVKKTKEEDKIDLGYGFEILVQEQKDTNGASTYGAILNYGNKLLKFFVIMPNTSKKEAVNNVYNYIKTLKVSDKIIENSPKKGDFRIYYNDRNGEYSKVFDSKNEAQEFINMANYLTSEDKSKPKSINYVAKRKIKEVVLEKDGKEIVVSAKDFLNGVNLYSGGGKLKNDHTYFAKRYVKEVVTEDGDKLKPSNGYWVKNSALNGSKKKVSLVKKTNFKVDDLVYNKRTKNIGIVRIEEEKGEVKTDADGNVNVTELEAYNPLKFKHQSKGKIAPSTQKEIDKRGLFKPFSKFESGGSTKRKVNIVNEGEDFDEKKYKAIYGDYDKDGTSNIDDANPLDKTKKGNVEQVELKETFTKLLKVKADLDSVMYSAIDKLDEKAPEDADIYARTKTPYSILKKLVDKRMLDPQKGLTDMIGTTIAVDNQKELEQVRDDIDGGLLGKILDRDDYYKNPKAGYRAYHYIVEYKGYPIEVQLKTKKMKKLNEVSHEFYKNGSLNAEGLERVSKIFEMADKGDKKAIKEVDRLLKNKELLASKISTSKSKKEYAVGGKTARGGAMQLAKQIRKDGESWQNALKRANEQMRNK